VDSSSRHLFRVKLDKSMLSSRLKVWDDHRFEGMLYSELVGLEADPDLAFLRAYEVYDGSSSGL